MTDIVLVLITLVYEYDESSDCNAQYDVLKLHGIFTQEGLIRYKDNIQKLRQSLPMNSLFIIPLDRFLEKGMKL